MLRFSRTAGKRAEEISLEKKKGFKLGSQRRSMPLLTFGVVPMCPWHAQGLEFVCFSAEAPEVPEAPNGIIFRYGLDRALVRWCV